MVEPRRPWAERIEDRMEDDVGIAPPIGTKERWGLTWIREFDENPGDDIIDKGTTWGIRGMIAGAAAGQFHAGVVQPPAGVNGLHYALRHMGVAGLMLGSFGAVLGVGIPIAQAIRKKNDPWAWAWGGFAAGSVFGLRHGKLATSIKFGSLIALCMAATKATGTYKDPYIDHYKFLRKPPPKHIKLLDENGDIILNPYQAC